MLVYVAMALAVALVLRRGDGPGRRRGGIRRRLTAIASYGLATRLFPDRFETSTDDVQRLPARRAARVLERPRPARGDRRSLLALGRRSARAARAGRSRRRRAAPCSWSTLYFTFSRGAWLALDRAVWPGRSSSTRVALRLLWSAPRRRRALGGRRRGRVDSRGVHDREPDDCLGGLRGECGPSAGLAARRARPRFGRARLGCASRSAGRSRCEACTARRSRRPRRRCGHRACGRVAGGGRADHVLAEIRERLPGPCRIAGRLSTIGSSAFSGNGREETIRGRVGCRCESPDRRDQGAGTFETLWYEDRRANRWFATRTRSTSRRSPSSGSSA